MTSHCFDILIAFERKIILALFHQSLNTYKKWILGATVFYLYREFTLKTNLYLNESEFDIVNRKKKKDKFRFVTSKPNSGLSIF